MREAISAHHVGGMVRMTGFILKTTFCIEFMGAALMAPVFCKDFGFFKGLWYAIFHSVSAFCNAGFDLLGVREEFSSITTYASQPIINFTIIDVYKRQVCRCQSSRKKSNDLLCFSGMGHAGVTL